MNQAQADRVGISADAIVKLTIAAFQVVILGLSTWVLVTQVDQGQRIVRLEERSDTRSLESSRLLAELQAIRAKLDALSLKVERNVNENR